jgi:hypothetical protein
LDSDFSLLENFLLKIGLRQIKELINKWNNDKGFNSNAQNTLDDRVLMISSIVGKYSSNEKRTKLPALTAG